MIDGTFPKLTELLIGFNTIKNIEAVVVASRNGINMGSSVPPKVNPDTLAAMCSALQNAADFLMKNIKNSTADRVVIECERDKIIIVNAGEKALLIVLTGEKSALGPLFMELKILSRQVRELLESD
ncbi:MAG: roadblock/LC7 domain-containing protein [ANME-2 cluster archaeon]|nr:roadblock/LC7 domain-containing protein [ANME-2 cluster archaeon]